MRQSRPIPLIIKPNFAIVVDGETEVWYLQMLKRNERSINVNIEPKIPQRKKISEQFDTVIRLSEDYTKVFWIVDLDVILKETKEAKQGNKTPLQAFLGYKETITEKHLNITFIINNPCLEFWLLLHFEMNAENFNNCSEAEILLKKYLPDYKKKAKYYTKEGSDIYLRLKPNLANALKNTKSLKVFDSENPYKGISEMNLFFEANEFGDLFKNDNSF